jgi:Protein CHAPERONE-LIKE PROTEIN OF POR1-like
VAANSLKQKIMSQPTPYERLGIGVDASFEEIQAAKQHLQTSSGGDQRAIDDIEAAYDSILMDRLKMRQEGKISVPEGIRFPEKSVQTLSLPKLAPPQLVNSKLGELVEMPTGRNLAIGAGVATVLAASAALPDTNGDGLPLLLALSAGYTLFSLKVKSNRLGRAFAITGLGLVASISLTILIINFAGLPVEGFGADKVAALVSIVVLWLIGCFLR